MNKIAVISTFSNDHWKPYAKQMVQSFVANWPDEIPLIINLDNNELQENVRKFLRPQDAIGCGWTKEHKDFVARNQHKDDPTNYRFQATRFCHKVFAIHTAYQVLKGTPEEPRYLIWMDADVHTTRKVTLEDIKQCLPKEGDAVAYLGRKDWPHSECGWLAFDLENGGDDLITEVTHQYLSDTVFKMDEWHDSWVWDAYMRRDSQYSCTNLTPNAIGMEVWQQSPMGKWSIHYKGPVAKQKLTGQQPQPQKAMQPNMGNIQINTRNSRPNEEIQANITRNQTLIKNWVKPCVATGEEIVMVSAGPMLPLYMHEIEEAARKGKKIVAVKHALTLLKKAGIKPWACILLDPRPHVADFVGDADPDILWFVASQVEPVATMELLARGCNVWGYHASVNAGEAELIKQQPGAIIDGGSATATRGLFLLHHLGFSNFTLYGYDLCEFDNVDWNAKTPDGQPKYLPVTVDTLTPVGVIKRSFVTEPQFIAQYQEVEQIINYGKIKLNATGDGMIPFLLRTRRLADLHRERLRGKIMGKNPPTYMEMLNGNGPARNAAGVKRKRQGHSRGAIRSRAAAAS